MSSSSSCSIWLRDDELSNEVDAAGLGVSGTIKMVDVEPSLTVVELSRSN